MNMKTQALLMPIDLQDITLKNRVIMAPMTRSRADNADNVVTGIHATYYAQRAGAGLIITEGSQISPQGVGYINTPGIYSDKQVEAWKDVTKAVHTAGGKIFLQLWHVGRISHPDFHNGELPVAPSALNPNEKSYTPEGFKETVVPKAMALDEIKGIINDFKQGAKNAWDAGFDGVEIHSSNGYLLHQFIASTSNVREDAYGDSVEKRARILFDILEAIKTVMPIERVGVRLNPSLHGIFGMTVNDDTLPTFDYIVKKLNDYPLAYLHLSEPFTDVSEVAGAEPNIAKRYRPLYKGNLMINGGFTQEKGNRFLKEGLADMVSYASLYIGNPDLVQRFKVNGPLHQADKATYYTPGAEGYIDYPTLAESQELADKA